MIEFECSRGLKISSSLQCHQTKDHLLQVSGHLHHKDHTLGTLKTPLTHCKSRFLCATRSWPSCLEHLLFPFQFLSIPITGPPSVPQRPTPPTYFFLVLFLSLCHSPATYLLSVDTLYIILFLLIPIKIDTSKNIKQFRNN